ncbi:MAG: hypothetical protein BWY75_03480 [bacterium ADurb.Bin425]|nr:MAG: hypothetical protein BWY75_03480 [bacterium ADurb.Bin425]
MREHRDELALESIGLQSFISAVSQFLVQFVEIFFDLQCRPYPGGELGWVKGLEEIVIGTGLPTFQEGIAVSQGGQKNNWY